MFLWFLVVAPVLMAEVFKSPMLDYRVVAFGAILPLAEVAIGGPSLGHTLLGATGLLTVVMLATIGRRLLRRRLLGIPIGVFMHLVLDLTWTDTQLFWWPAFGFDFASPTPEVSRGIGLGVLLELGGLAIGYWAFKRYQLDLEANRRQLFRSGRLKRGIWS